MSATKRRSTTRSGLRTGVTPRGPRWLVDRAVDPGLADDINGEIEYRWRTASGSRLGVTLHLYRFALSVAWHAFRERRRPLVADETHRRRTMLNLRLAIRRWTVRPALALTAIAVLALGLGATTSIASIVDAVLLRPLPWMRADELVDVFVERPAWRANPVLAGSAASGTISWVMLKTIQRDSRTLATFGAWQTARQTLNGPDNEPVRTMSVTASFLPMLGVSPARGRFFTAEEDDTPSDIALISWESWQRRHGLREDIVGQMLSIDEQRFRIAGVLPRGFRFGSLDGVEVILPLGRTPLPNRTEGNHFLNGIGRLADLATVAQATQELHPWISGTEGLDQKRARVTAHDADRRAGSSAPLLMLFGAAGLLLLIATANVAALLLGDATTRRQEMAIRAALGGTRRDVSRQLFVEHLVLAVAAAGAGLLVAAVLTPLLLSLVPAAIPLADTARLDARVFALAGLLAVATAIGFGVFPSMLMAGGDPAGALREAGREGGLHRARGFRWVVVGQLALATVLLVGAGLFVETVRRLSSQPLGFDADQLAVATLRLPALPGATPEERAARRAQRTQSIIDRLAAEPGVTQAAAASSAPFSGGLGTSSIQIPGKTFEKDPNTQRHIVTDRYFETMGIPIFKGRGFLPEDQFGGHAAVVSDEFERVLMDGDALGKRFVLNGDEHTIVGVIRSTRQRRHTDPPSIAMYALGRQLPQWTTHSFVVRTASDAELALPQVRHAIVSADPQASFLSLEPMAAMTRRSLGEERYRAQLTAAFGILAVALSAIGLYGLVARSVTDRRREMGVRLALGADPVAVRRLVMRQALRLVALGLGAGVPLAVGISYALRGFLFDVAPASPVVVALAASVLALAATAAAFVPALRAGRTDPIEALRAR